MSNDLTQALPAALPDVLSLRPSATVQERVTEAPALNENPADYRKALSCFATGVTVVTARW